VISVTDVMGLLLYSLEKVRKVFDLQLQE